MRCLNLLFSIAIVLINQHAYAKDRLTDPLKIARECKSEAELFCKGVRPGGQRMLICLRQKMAELSPACVVALKSAE